jgi:hypothetical protein
MLSPYLNGFASRPSNKLAALWIQNVAGILAVKIVSFLAAFGKVIEDALVHPALRGAQWEIEGLHFIAVSPDGDNAVVVFVYGGQLMVHGGLLVGRISWRR